MAKMYRLTIRYSHRSCCLCYSYSYFFFLLLFPLSLSSLFGNVTATVPCTLVFTHRPAAVGSAQGMRPLQITMWEDRSHHVCQFELLLQEMQDAIVIDSWKVHSPQKPLIVRLLTVTLLMASLASHFKR